MVDGESEIGSSAAVESECVLSSKLLSLGRATVQYWEDLWVCKVCM